MAAGGSQVVISEHPRPSEENSPRKHPEGHLAKKHELQVVQSQEQSALVVGEVNTRDWCRRSAPERTLDSESALVVGGVLRQKRKNDSQIQHGRKSKVRLLLVRKRGHNNKRQPPGHGHF